MLVTVTLAAPAGGAVLTTEFTAAGLADVALVVDGVLITASTVEFPVVLGVVVTVPLVLTLVGSLAFTAAVFERLLFTADELMPGTKYFIA
jgi:hypothetical protein